MNGACAGRAGLCIRIVACSVIAGVSLITFSGTAQAQDMRYSLGTIQEERQLTAVAGQSRATTLAFYNIDGNLPTVVNLEVTDAPPDWLVTLERPGESADASASLTLVVEPTVPQASETRWAGLARESVWLPQRGWIYADVVQVTMRAPESAIDGTRGLIRVGATVTWEVNGSSAPFPQEREFYFDITVSGRQVAPEALDVPPESPDASIRVPLLCASGAALGVLLLALRRILEKTKRVE